MKKRGSTGAPAAEDWIELHPYVTNDNQYAWRLNCEDGSKYGIYPEDYETRDEYNMAIHAARINSGWEERIVIEEEPEALHDSPKVVANLDQKIICKVSLLSSGENKFFLTDDSSIVPGDLVELAGEEWVKGIVLTAEPLAGIDHSFQINQMKTVMKCGQP